MKGKKNLMGLNKGLDKFIIRTIWPSCLHEPQTGPDYTGVPYYFCFPKEIMQAAVFVLQKYNAFQNTLSK